MGGQYFGRREKQDCPLTVKYVLCGWHETENLNCFAAGPNSDEGTDTVVLGKYVLCGLNTNTIVENSSLATVPLT
jgi:hypothetical protein